MYLQIVVSSQPTFDISMMMEIEKHIGTALSLEYCNYKKLLHLGAARVKLISLSSALSVSAVKMCHLQTTYMLETTI